MRITQVGWNVIFSLTKCGEIIHKEHLPSEIFSKSELAKFARRKSDATDGQIKKYDSEKNSIQAMLEKTDWNKAKAARLLGISRATLYTKLLKYGIEGKTEDI